MIISQNVEKVKRKAKSLIDKRSCHLTVPKRKFLLEMTMGMVMTGSSNLSEIGRSLQEPLELKQTTKRFSRMLEHEHLLEECNALSLSEAVSKIDEETILALDTGDITHQYGESFEHLEYVHDGSNKQKKTEKGYWLNQVSGYNTSSRDTFPVLLDIYSTSEKDFKSANNESLTLVDKVVNEVGSDALWVMDRGYDGGIILEWFLERSLNFAVRMNFSRNLLVKGKSLNIKEVASKINRRVTYNKKSRFGSKKVQIKLNRKEYDVTLICFKDERNKDPMLLLCNGWIKSTVELKRRIKGYFRRWGVEESYRFEKQGFGIEKCKIRKFSRIKTMLGITLLSWLLLIKINESPRLKETVLKVARMEKNKLKDRPKFIYYRLLKGVQNLFAGIKVLFRFRWKKDRKRQYREELKMMRPLFPDSTTGIDWLETVA